MCLRGETSSSTMNPETYALSLMAGAFVFPRPARHRSLNTAAERTPASERGSTPHRVDHAAMNPGTRAADRGHARNGRERGRLFTGGVMVMIHPERDKSAALLAVEEQLAKLCTQAKRKPRAIALFEADPPTEWDTAHRALDVPLDEWLDARG